jgi:hypothetical protein
MESFGQSIQRHALAASPSNTIRPNLHYKCQKVQVANTLIKFQPSASWPDQKRGPGAFLRDEEEPELRQS